LALGILAVAVKAPDGLAVVYTGAAVGSSVRVNAWEYRMRASQSLAAASGPTDPDRVTDRPATTGLGRAWTTTAAVLVEAAAAGAAETARVPAVAASTNAAMRWTGRMVISPDSANPTVQHT
jgi:hypothetical protein